ncbi:hypothetical protein DSO57_1026209 [Entomophthora muscae]|uniref:Uncharacterized protein n=1 Tax=Entomophthora muscae TaxID=34485 RepID=A0ACC2T271_9FUNG|nr:hypothetical protein DSO57_1026209 [Entomophthora muscae]
MGQYSWVGLLAHASFRCGVLIGHQDRHQTQQVNEIVQSQEDTGSPLVPRAGSLWAVLTKVQTLFQVLGLRGEEMSFLTLCVRNDSLEAPESQSMEPVSNPKQNPLQTASSKDWESNSPLPIDKVVANLPGPNPLTTFQGSARKLPGDSFGPVHFTKYPLKPKYKDYTTDNLLTWDPLARTKELTRYNQKGSWHVTKPCLFRDKYNVLPTYQIDMEPPVTPKPMPVSTTKLPLDHTNKLFGIVYITITGGIDTIVPIAGYGPGWESQCPTSLS